MNTSYEYGLCPNLRRFYFCIQDFQLLITKQKAVSKKKLLKYYYFQ